jgi:hypothetical protein
MWSVVIACLIDVSPWLCYDFVLGHRATIALIAMKLILILVVAEQKLYEWTLERTIRTDTLEI